MRAALGVVVVCCALTGCTGDPSPAPSGPPSPPAPVTPPAPALPSGAVALDCSAPIDTLAEPPAGYTTAAGVIALADREPVGLSASAPLDPHHRFGKTGLLVRAGRTATLSVGPEAAISWGNTGSEWTRTLYVPVCPQPAGAHGPWLAYPGGYSVDAPACLPVVINGVTLRIPLGRPC
ncbi:hypothetical protein [Cryptosporangium sp. NPDC051539]|uniref:hypothetical protein n=1 Tax=Cryptosporangium sp. NPDC051539 TaxID=3363962 RepID=UPI00378F0272